MSRSYFTSVAAAALAAASAGAQLPMAPPAKPAPALGVDYLVGGWIPTETDNRCGTDTAMEYRADGTWRTFGRGGPFSVSGDRITLRSTNGEPSNEHIVTIIGPNRYSVQVVGGPAFVMRRCGPDEGAPRKGG
ncbi:MAG: hypothetical protein QOI38_1902 [Sphingomonadales bacterium]|jgi:hypothetical protein|nr:hypothetical protein [Sphingomonadales bacterium]